MEEPKWGITLKHSRTGRLKHKRGADVDDLKHISDDEWCDIVKTDVLGSMESR